MNYALNILLENASSFSERKEILALTESEASNINNNMVAKLFKSAIDKSHVDFDDIPASKGDITKYTGYTQMVECLSLVRQIADQNGHKLTELDIVEKAISNIIAYRAQFEAGIKLNKDFVILQYNTLVAACVVGTSAIISSYMDYAKRVDAIEFKIINSKLSSGNLCIASLDSFNKSVASGEFSKAINAVVKSDNMRAVGESVVTITATIIVGLIGLLAISRHLVHYFYYSRMKISEYLKMQAMFLELNRNNLKANSNGLPAEKRNKIIDNQQSLIDKLLKLSDKIKVNSTMTERKVKVEEKKEESGWKFADVKSDSVSHDSNGIQLL